MSNKKLLICLHPYSNKGGATIKIQQILNNLSPKNFEIVYLYIKKNSKLNLNTNIKTIKIKSKRTLFAYFEIKKIISTYNQKKFSKKIFISNQNYSNVLVYYLLRGFKDFKSVLIERNHLDELYYYNSVKDFIKKFIIKILMKMNYKYSDRIIGNAKKLSKDLSKFVNKKVHTIYSPNNPKEILKFSKVYKPKFFLKDEKKIRLLSISRFTKRKNIITLIKAFNEINKKYVNFELILIGYGPELKKIKSFITENKLNKNIFILDYIENPYPYFLISDLYISTSLYEGCPNSIIEAIILNLPVISSNCNSGPDEILLKGKGGFIFQKKNFHELANLLELFLLKKNIFIKKTNIAKKNLYRFDQKKIIGEYNFLLNNL